MEKALFKRTLIKISKETLFILLTVASAVILPQIFHGVGVLLGVGGKLGQILLPMYLPVLIIGFYRGIAPGAVAGFFAPLISFALTGMPQESLLPYITVELIATGALAGVFAKIKIPATLRVLSVQALAKALRLIIFAIALYSANGAITATALFAGIVSSIPGILLQLILVSYLIIKKEKSNA